MSESYSPMNVDMSSYDKNKMLLRSNKGDQIDIYDEEREWWESATITNIYPLSKQISFECDNDFDSKWPANHANDDKKPYSSQCHIEDFDFAKDGFYTIKNVKPLLFPINKYVVNDEIITYFDNDRNENIIFGVKPMLNNDDEDIASTEIMIYNINKNEMYNDNKKRDISVDCIVNDLTQNIFNAHYWTQRIFNIDDDDDDECCNLNKVYISSSNQIHVLSHDLCNEYTYHLECDLNRMSVKYLGGFHSDNGMISDGKLIYVASINKLMYFGGKDSDDSDDWFSRNIWFYDLNNSINPKWRLYPLKLPENDDNKFNVISAGELLFIFYNNSRNIYIYDLTINAAYKLSKQYPAPYKGKAVAIKTRMNYIHFMNASKLIKNLKVTLRPYHFKIHLKELIPHHIHNALISRYNVLIYHFIHLYTDDRFGSDMSRFLKLQIEKYFPMFL